MIDILNSLARPFDAKKISWRVGATSKDKTKAIALAYIDARDVMERLDDVFGLNWQCKYSHAETKTICEISVLIDGTWITRANGAGDSDIEAEKGAISDAFKRAAVLFGVGRYLYSLPNEWVEIDEYKKIKRPPTLPAWATPEGYDKKSINLKQLVLTDDEFNLAVETMASCTDIETLKGVFGGAWKRANDKEKVSLQNEYNLAKAKLEKAA